MSKDFNHSDNSHHYTPARASNDGCPAKGRLASRSLLAQLGHKLAQRKWAIVMALALLAAGMAWTFLWPATSGHLGTLYSPGDIWGSYNDAQGILLGHYGSIYTHDAGFIVGPGILLSLVPVAFLGTHFRLATDIPFAVPHPWAWLLIEPCISLMMILPLAGIDKAAECLGATSRARLLAVGLAAFASFECLYVWGHPEIPIATGLVIYGLLAAWDNRPVATGWLFGAALGFQPMAILVAPLALALLLPRQWWSVIWRAALVPMVLLAVPLIARFHQTFSAFLQEATFPKNPNLHPTPWIALAPVLAKGVVSGSRTRIGAEVVDLVIGLWAWRHRPERLVSVIWLAGLMLSMWCVFEAVMISYYLTPGVMVLLAVCALGPKQGHRVQKVLVSSLAGAGVEAWTFIHVGEWLYWLVMLGLLCILWLASMPARQKTPQLQRSPASEEVQGSQPIESQQAPHLSEA